MAGKVVNPCGRCNKESSVKAEIAKEKRVIMLCPNHIEPHAEALKHQKFVLTDL